MARKNYPDEFKRDAVALYRDTEGAKVTQIADELGMSEADLHRDVELAPLGPDEERSDQGDVGPDARYSSTSCCVQTGRPAKARCTPRWCWTRSPGVWSAGR